MALLERLFNQPKNLNPADNKTLPQEASFDYRECTGIRIQAIKELIPPIDTILSEMKEKMQQNTYDMLIGDDTSGRIPTLIFRGVINSIRKENGDEPIPVFFVRSDYGRLPAYDRKRLTQQIRSVEKPTPKALIITDYMSSGLHVRRIGDIVHKSEASYDIAAMSRNNELCQKGLHRHEQIYPLKPRPDKLPAIYNRPELTGLSRSSQTPVLYPDREYVIRARNDVQTVIQILSKRHSQYHSAN